MPHLGEAMPSCMWVILGLIRRASLWRGPKKSDHYSNHRFEYTHCVCSRPLHTPSLPNSLCQQYCWFASFNVAMFSPCVEHLNVQAFIILSTYLWGIYGLEKFDWHGCCPSSFLTFLSMDDFNHELWVVGREGDFLWTRLLSQCPLESLIPFTIPSALWRMFVVNATFFYSFVVQNELQCL